MSCCHPPHRSQQHRLVTIRGGADAEAYASRLESVETKVLESVTSRIDTLRRQIMDEGVADLGATADAICNQALEDFGNESPAADAATSSAFNERILAEVEAAVDAPMHVLYLQQLAYLRDAALQGYRADTQGDYEAMLTADEAFVQQAEAATREGSD